jgi:hypothetical protein
MPVALAQKNYSRSAINIGGVLLGQERKPEVQIRSMPVTTSPEVRIRSMPVTVRPATRRRIYEARRLGRPMMVRKYGQRLTVLERNPGAYRIGTPMLTFVGQSWVSLNKEPNNIYEYEFCYAVKNTGTAASSPAKIHVEVEANNNPSLELKIDHGKSDVEIPAVAPDQVTTVCGGMIFEQLLHAKLAPLQDQPRFFATITGELNDGKTVLLYPEIMRRSKSGSGKSPSSGAFLSFQPVVYPAKYNLQSNVINACFSINNSGNSNSTSAVVKVSAIVNGIVTSGSVPIPPLDSKTAMKVVCGDIAIKGLKENKLANLTPANFQFTGVISGAVNDGSSIYYEFEYNNIFVDY